MAGTRRGRRTRTLRIGLWVTAGAVVLMTVFVVGLHFMDWTNLRGAAGERASNLLGRTVAIDGELDVDIGWVPQIVATDVRIANADWAEPADMLRVERIRFRIDLWELLKGQVVLPEVEIARAELALTRNEDGLANWNFAPASGAAAAAEAVTPDERDDFPVIRRLLIEQSSLRFDDATRGIEIDADIAQATGEGPETDRLFLSGKGRFQDEPFTLKIEGGSVLRLQDEENPYPLRIDATVGRTKVVFDGTFTNLMQQEVFDIALDLSGATLSDLFPIFGIPLPPTPPYSLSGRLTRDGAAWTVAGLDGKVGDSDLSGDLTIDTKPETPFMEARLVSRRLDFDDMAGLIGATPQTGAGETASRKQERRATQEAQDRRVLPDVPIELERLRAMNMVVEFTGSRIDAPNLPLDSLKANLKLEDGVLTLEPVEFGVAEGRIGGTLILDGRKATPRVRADMKLREISLKPFFAKTDMADLTEGRIGGKLTLTGDGRSLADVLSTGDGRVVLAMRGGSLSPLVVELVGLDIAESLAVVVSDASTPVAIRCAFGAFDVANGAMETKGVVVDTADSTLIGTGAINLGTEKLSLHVHADPKDPSLLSANAPIAITGSFANPNVSIDPTLTAGEGLFDQILSLADPILALLPAIDLGIAEDRNCGALLKGDVQGSARKKSNRSAIDR